MDTQRPEGSFRRQNLTASRNQYELIVVAKQHAIQIDVLVLKLTEGVLFFVILGVLGIRIVGIVECYWKRLKMKRWKSMRVIVEYCFIY